MKGLTDSIILSDMLTVSVSPFTLFPATLADMIPEPMALYVSFSFSDWLRRSGKRMSLSYMEKKTPVSSLLISSNTLAGMVILLSEFFISASSLAAILVELTPVVLLELVSLLVVFVGTEVVLNSVTITAITGNETLNIEDI